MNNYNELLFFWLKFINQENKFSIKNNTEYKSKYEKKKLYYQILSTFVAEVHLHCIAPASSLFFYYSLLSNTIKNMNIWDNTSSPFI